MKQLHLGTSTPLEPFASQPFSGTGYNLPSGPLRAKGYEMYRLTRMKEPRRLTDHYSAMLEPVGHGC